MIITVKVEVPEEQNRCWNCFYYFEERLDECVLFDKPIISGPCPACIEARKKAKEARNE